MIYLFFFATLLIFLFETLTLIKNKLWRELSTVGCLVGIALYLGVSKLLGIATPVNWLQQLLDPLGKLIFK